MTELFISIGSNVEPRRQIAEALSKLRAVWPDLRLSPVYECPSVGFSGPPFLNLIAAAHTTDSAACVRSRLRAIEDAQGRQRDVPKFSDRCIDLDLVLYGAEVIETPEWRLPRAEVLEQAFVLKPLVDLAGERCHPVTGRPLAEHLRDLKQQLDELLLVEWP